MSAVETVRRFARATNLVVAGRRFRVAGDGGDAEGLRAILRALGARDVPVGERVDHLWCTEPVDLETLEAVHGDAPLVVIDAGSGHPALDLPALGPAAAARPGVVALDSLPGVFVVPHGDAATDVAAEASPEESVDPAAARARFDWARLFMPVSARLAEFDDTGLYGLRIALSMVLEPKTAVLALLMRDAGAVVDVFAHADETDDAVADALRAEGVDVFASSAATPGESRELALRMLDLRPDLLIDDGAHVIRLAHEARPELLGAMIGAAEETTSGLRPLRVMAARGELRLPVIAVNDAAVKSSFDNRYGTGQSCVMAILDLAAAAKKVRKRVAPGRTAVVAGFGPVGQGVAQALAAVGLRVVVSEIDPVRALQAAYAGYDVAPLIDAAAHADLVVSATGVRDTVSLDVLRACPRGTVVAVAGGVEGEVAAIPGAQADGGEADGAEADGAEADIDVVLLADGGCVNIVAGEGNPVEIMDLSFAAQLAAIRTLLDAHGRLEPGVHPIGAEADARIAAAALDALGLSGGVGADDDDPAPDFDRDPATVDTRTRRFDSGGAGNGTSTDATRTATAGTTTDATRNATAGGAA